MKFIFLGTPDFSVQVLRYLLEHGKKPEAVFTPKDKPFGRKQVITPCSLKIFAESQALPVLHDLKKIHEIAPDVGVVVAYGKIIPESILGICPFINIHPSLLPKYRGPSPLQYAILQKEKETGVTLMFLDKGMDTGPIISQVALPLSSSETARSLGEKLFAKGAQLLLPLLNKDFQYIDSRPQNHSLATYTKIFTREDGELHAGDDLQIKLRALHPWPGVWMKFQGKRIKILPGKSEIMLQEEGGKPLPREQFARFRPEFLKIFSAFCESR